MKRCFYVLFGLLMSLAVRAQTIYKEYEVDSIARPIGGLPLLEKFINVNRRMPYAAEVSQTKGVVILSAIVEPNGTVSAARALRSLHPDCDREAIRVLSLFKAWKPALKDGKPVRQELTYTIRFTPGEWECKPDQTIRYFNHKGDLTINRAKAKYQLRIPVDSLGYPSGSPVVYQKSGKNWKEFERLQFRKEPFTHFNYDNPAQTDSADAYRLKIVDKTGANQDIHYAFLTDGRLLETEPYSDGRRIRSSYYYGRDGIVKRLEERTQNHTFMQWLWYPNGQLYQIALHEFDVQAYGYYRLINQWDSTGTPTVVDGTGIASEISQRDGRMFRERGALKNSYKEGEWTGRFQDGPLFYREIYKNGKFMSGKFYKENGEIITYNELSHPPEFQGGLTALAKFLITNIQYPAEASRAGIQGRVTVSFVVDTEGNVDDVTVLRGIGHGTHEEAVRVVKATSGKWTPGVQQGRTVKVNYALAIYFTGQKILFLAN
ncbi:TonB family protein [Larkinella punicea]|uniref:TonB family protein n=1 Tax=Larkinella punicea TaxID=2315727 RepID=A0A368JGZ6_9BACT|nr:TonB family protein [Larkinella punicea]RCR66940.1 TonB family protein [Larkinella punicea]